MEKSGLFQDTEGIVIIVIVLFVFIVISALLKKSGASSTSREIGDVTCNRCGHKGYAKAGAGFKPFHGVTTKLTCERCGSEDWRAA